MIDPCGSPTLSRPEAATYLGVKVSTLENWASSGRYSLPFVKVGRTVRYLKSDLDHFLEKRRRTWPHGTDGSSESYHHTSGDKAAA